MKKSFLILDDEMWFREECLKGLKEAYPDCDVFETDSLDHATDTVSEGGYRACLSCVLLDGVNPDGVDYPSYAATLRKKGYAGPIIAMSSDTYLRELMLQHGCSHEATEKSKVVEVVKTILTD